jgi:hypothetical protein
MNEEELRNKIAEEVSHDLELLFENVACLGRDAYGRYINNCVTSVLNKIKNKKE